MAYFVSCDKFDNRVPWPTYLAQSMHVKALSSDPLDTFFILILHHKSEREKKKFPDRICRLVASLN